MPAQAGMEEARAMGCGVKAALAVAGGAVAGPPAGPPGPAPARGPVGGPLGAPAAAREWEAPPGSLACGSCGVRAASASGAPAHEPPHTRRAAVG